MMTLIGRGTVGVRPHGTLAQRQITHGAITQVGLEALAYHFFQSVSYFFSLTSVCKKILNYPRLNSKIKKILNLKL